MERDAVLLASIEDFGSIYRCGGCGNIHLQIGPVNLLTSVDGYMQLVALVNSSAANFEAAIARPEAEDHEPY